MAVDKRLTPEQVEGSAMAIAFVRALLLGTDPEINKGHLKDPCPVAFWEDGYQLDNDLLPNIKGIDADRKK